MTTNFAPVDKARAAMVKTTMPKRFGDLEKSSDAYAELVVNDALAVTSANYYDRSTTAIKSFPMTWLMQKNFGKRVKSSPVWNKNVSDSSSAIKGFYHEFVCALTREEALPYKVPPLF